MFDPPLALASLSGASDAAWARAGAAYAGAAFLGGIAVCERTRDAARAMVGRGRDEFLPRDPFTFIERQFEALADVDMRVGFNVRAVDSAALRRAAAVCGAHDAIIEINAHCRQEEMCAVGAGETLLGETDRLAEQVGVAAETDAMVSVKVRADVPGVDLVETARSVAESGADILHVDAMDSEEVIADLAGRHGVFVIANNGVRDRVTVDEYLDYGADAISVGRPSDNPAVLDRVRRAVETWERRRSASAPGRG